jgi:hypothetical protein
MPSRASRAFVLAGALVALVAACSPAAVAPSPASPANPTPPLTGGTGGTGGTGNVDRPQYPELDVSEEPGSLLVTLADPEAKAWRIRVEGSGAALGSSLEILVETGDVEYNIVARSTSGGALLDENDLTGMVGDPTAAAGGCHPLMPVCYSSAAFTLPSEGSGRLEVGLDLPEPIGALRITGATSPWFEPFVLGPWRETEAFTTAG